MSWLAIALAFKAGVLATLAAQAGFKALQKVLPRRFEEMEARQKQIEARLAELGDAIAAISMTSGFRPQTKK